MGSFLRRLVFLFRARALARIAVGLLLVVGLWLLCRFLEDGLFSDEPRAYLTDLQRSAQRNLQEGHAQPLVNGCMNVLGPPLAAIVILSFRILRQYRLRFLLPTTAKALATLRRQRRPYAVLLRPFGRDGFIHLQTAPAETAPEPKPWWQRRSRSPWREWQDTWRSSATAESLLAMAVQVNLGVSNTLALVEPWQLVLPPGPRFVRASSDWRRDVLDLLQGAVMVAILFPPGKDCTLSVRWEIEQCIRLGLVGRLLFLLPPETLDDARATRRRLHELADLFPSIDRVPAGVLALFPKTSGRTRFWHVPADDSPGGRHPVTAETYAGCLDEAVSEVAAEASGEPAYSPTALGP